MEILSAYWSSSEFNEPILIEEFSLQIKLEILKLNCI